MYRATRKPRQGSTNPGKPKPKRNRVVHALGVFAVAVAAFGFAAAPASADGGRDEARGKHYKHSSHRGHSQSYGHHRGHGHYKHHGHQRSHGHYQHHGHHRGHGHYSHRVSTCRLVPGYYETRTRRVQVSAGHYDKVWHPAEYGIRYDSRGHRIRVVVSAGHYDSVWHPAEYRTERYRHWVPARYACSSGCTIHRH